MFAASTPLVRTLKKHITRYFHRS